MFAYHESKDAKRMTMHKTGKQIKLFEHTSSLQLICRSDIVGNQGMDLYFLEKY